MCLTIKQGLCTCIKCPFHHFSSRQRANIIRPSVGAKPNVILSRGRCPDNTIRFIHKWLPKICRRSTIDALETQLIIAVIELVHGPSHRKWTSIVMNVQRTGMLGWERKFLFWLTDPRKSQLCWCLTFSIDRQYVTPSNMNFLLKWSKLRRCQSPEIIHSNEDSHIIQFWYQ